MTTVPSTDARTDTRPDLLAEVCDVLVRVLGIEDRAATIDADTALLGELPELDSLGVVELAQALENRFDVVIDDDDFTAEVFATVGSLAAFVDSRSS
jgi:acyl carrier protein